MSLPQYHQQGKIFSTSWRGFFLAAIAPMPDNKQFATLLAFTHLLEYTATDDVIGLLDLPINWW